MSCICPWNRVPWATNGFSPGVLVNPPKRGLKLIVTGQILMRLYYSGNVVSWGFAWLMSIQSRRWVAFSRCGKSGRGKEPYPAMVVYIKQPNSKQWSMRRRWGSIKTIDKWCSPNLRERSFRSLPWARQAVAISIIHELLIKIWSVHSADRADWRWVPIEHEVSQSYSRLSRGTTGVRALIEPVMRALIQRTSKHCSRSIHHPNVSQRRFNICTIFCWETITYSMCRDRPRRVLLVLITIRLGQMKQYVEWATAYG